MAELHVDRIHTEEVVLDIGGDVGALILYTGPHLREHEIELSADAPGAPRFHNQVHERHFNGRRVFAAVYPEIREGRYVVWGDADQPVDRVTIRGGQIAELDWR